MIKNNWLLVGLLLTTSFSAAHAGIKEVQDAINAYNSSKSDQEKKIALKTAKDLIAKPATYLTPRQVDAIAQLKRDYEKASTITTPGTDRQAAAKTKQAREDAKKPVLEKYNKLFTDLGIPAEMIPPIA